MIGNNTCTLVVTYNRPELLSRCLDSIVNQSIKPSGLIIIDNASSIDTFNKLVGLSYLSTELVEEHDDYYIQEVFFRDIKIHYFRFPYNRGAAYAFYFGVKRFLDFEYDRLWIMDDDGYPDSAALSKLVEFSDRFDFLNSIVVDENNHELLSFDFFFPLTKESFKWKSELLSKSKDGMLWSWACPFNGTMISRNLVKSIGLPLYEMYGWGVEVEYMFRAKQAGFEVVTICDAVHYHPRSRVERANFLFGRYSVDIQSNKLKNYLLFRNNNYIWFNYGGLLVNLKHFLLYSIYFILNLRLIALLNYSVSALDGILKNWRRFDILQNRWNNKQRIS